MMGLSNSSRLIVLGSELCEDKFGSLLGLVKGLILDVWELRKVRLYGDNPRVQQTQSQIASGELQGVDGGRGELRCLGGETDTSCSYGVCSVVNGSAHCSGCVVYYYCCEQTYYSACAQPVTDSDLGKNFNLHSYFN